MAVALPLLVSTASWTVMNFVDRMFLLWVSETSFAAALPAAMLEWTIFCLPMGIASYVGTFVAQYYGAGRYERVGAAMAQAVRFSLCVTPVLLVGVPPGILVARLAPAQPYRHASAVVLTYALAYLLLAPLAAPTVGVARFAGAVLLIVAMQAALVLAGAGVGVQLRRAPTPPAR